MKRKAKRPIIEVTVFHDGNATIYEVYGKVYAHIFREKLRRAKSAPLQAKPKTHKLKSS